ncbi:MAG: hypothetical protein AB1473_19535 [Thermodesulfobacteriota bacterium]
MDVVESRADFTAPPRHMAWLGPLLLGLVLAVSGCSLMTSGAEVTLSPDGTWAAYVCAEQWDLPLPPENPTIRSKILVRWCTLERPEDYQEVEIGVFGKDWAGWHVKNRVHLALSPDNRYVAVASPLDLRLIDCTTKTGRTLTGQGEIVTSFIWLDKERLAYASCQSDTAKQQTSRTNFWQQGVDQSFHERRLIFAEDSESCSERGLGSPEWPRERWSPDGAFVLFKTRAFRGELKLLDVATRTAKVIGSRDYNFEGISWKSDSSEVVCVGSKRGSPARAFLLNPRTLEEHDFSDEFNAAFVNDSGYRVPPIVPIWTPDDRYFIVNHSKKGGCLVSPRPWKVIPIARLLIDDIVRDRSLVLMEDTTKRPPWIFRQPAQGWVRVWVQFQEKGYPRGMDYLVDYSARVFVAFAESSSPGDGWKLTPNGKRAVRLASPCKLVVRAVSLPSSD